MSCKCKDKSNCCCPKTIRGAAGKTGPQGPKGLTGDTGATGATGFMIAQALYDVTSVTDYITKAGGNPYVSIAKLTFPGTTAVGTPKTVLANIWGSGAKNKQVRIYDATNAVAVAEKLIISSTSPENIETLDSIALVFPAAAAVFEIQVLAESAEEVIIAGVTIY